MHSLILNHPFIDGNKRTSSASTLVFLEINGWRLKVNQDLFLQAVLAIESKKMSIEDIAKWIQVNSEKI